jgi:hypothetical protein
MLQSHAQSTCTRSLPVNDSCRDATPARMRQDRSQSAHHMAARPATGRRLASSMQIAPRHHLASIRHPPRPLFSPQTNADAAASRSAACRAQTSRQERRSTAAAHHDIDNSTCGESFERRKTPSNPLEEAVERAFPTAGAPEAGLLVVVFAGLEHTRCTACQLSGLIRSWKAF